MNKRSKGIKYTKKFTVEQWKRFDKWAERENGIDYTMQEVLLRFYKIILTDHVSPKSKKEKAISILKKFNQKNLDKGLAIFDKGMEQFSKQMDDFGKAFDANNKPSSRKRDNVKLWSDAPKRKNSKSTIKIWTDSPKRKKKSKKKKHSQSQGEKNIEKLMGSKPKLF